MSKLRSLNQHLVSNLETHKAVTSAKRNLILLILKSTTTKREARNYLNKYQNQFDSSDTTFNYGLLARRVSERDTQRELFVNRFLNKQNPFNNIYDEEETKLAKIPLRLALFRIKFTNILVAQWKGMAETFKRLVQIGISPVIILDYDHLPADSFKSNEQYMNKQAIKIMNYLGRPEELLGLKTLVLRSLFSVNEDTPNIDSLEQILIPLYQGIIPIIQPIVFNKATSSQAFIASSKLLYALSSLLLQTRDLLSIEKVVMIDPIGGIPSIERNQTSHVFINLSQEYADIVLELFIGFIKPGVRDLHMDNLNAMSDVLSLALNMSGNDDTTGIITTPHIMSINNDQLNPIIYNVLTDRPVISSSLPSSLKRTPQVSTSILKKGIDVKTFGAEDYLGEFTFDNLVADGLIDKAKLVALINDSFGKQLKVDEYLRRINNNLATVVIVGDYDGAAIITWELPLTAPKKRIAYLDKFAIAKRNQGLPGLADIIFKIILQSHPQELMWRSQRANPVNKWYFDRCVGSMSVTNSPWKIFYTGDVFSKRIRLNQRQGGESIDISGKIVEYIDVAEGIPPSF